MSAKFSPSLMCMDLTQFKEQITAMNKKADFYHVDIMDGNYVRNITLSPFFIENLKKITTVPIDVHLMVNHPEDFIPMCLEAGADIISFHPETANNKIFRLLNQIKDAGKKCGVVLNPATPAESIAEYAHLLDKVTVMSVDPGYAGQKFIPESLNKIRKLINMRKNNGYHYLTEIDGSCNEKTFGQIAESGVDVFIVGTSGLFSLHEDVSQAWDRMIEIFQRETVAA
ncbi:D-allulose 6-phosphate 3-epimerase [Klebsiella pneumoniae]|jgi:D-allulose-6-phosphate 3-epimerase|uniref:D-allulose 6-phosphate 3-epimerase n=1 Tax=Klebsiella pneumoniae TaxID=573 RepID=UPI0002B5A1AA|nr:D-allulose 6-phosphate 3-epimerase [Klebsiella pneumoniae]AGX37916.1 allulose-6-phosphate 3-epimerase [Klebsiella pneumoniae CG43]AJB32411.1 Ribulose-phosphate 3-epimerase [Klebsiella pneumoniae HK787]ARN26463.1 allulose-6-phosphate 3-epimerase [Klebsiella pneumoniae]AVB72176.1 ribulose-phosphate 3-epimerase [Klebsiella pneumoniae]EMB10048.1 allulose-6-phosphate 3-epimerase [Klebsiella pneumoniae hvKP1]